MSMYPGETIPISCELTLKCLHCGQRMIRQFLKGEIFPREIQCVVCKKMTKCRGFTISPEDGIYTLKEMLRVLSGK